MSDFGDYEEADAFEDDQQDSAADYSSGDSNCGKELVMEDDDDIETHYNMEGYEDSQRCSDTVDYASDHIDGEEDIKELEDDEDDDNTEKEDDDNTKKEDDDNPKKEDMDRDENSQRRKRNDKLYGAATDAAAHGMKTIAASLATQTTKAVGIIGYDAYKARTQGSSPSKTTSPIGKVGGPAVLPKKPLGIGKPSPVSSTAKTPGPIGKVGGPAVLPKKPLEIGKPSPVSSTAKTPGPIGKIGGQPAEMKSSTSTGGGTKQQQPVETKSSKPTTTTTPDSSPSASAQAVTQAVAQSTKSIVSIIGSERYFWTKHGASFIGFTKFSFFPFPLKAEKQNSFKFCVEWVDCSANKVSISFAYADGQTLMKRYIGCRKKDPIGGGALAEWNDSVRDHQNVFTIHHNESDHSFLFLSHNKLYMHYNETTHNVAFKRCHERDKKDVPMKGRWLLLNDYEAERTGTKSGSIIVGAMRAVSLRKSTTTSLKAAAAIA
jgi:hypothetical protein